MGRIDYIDDPAAPAINSVVPSVVAIVHDDEGRVLSMKAFWEPERTMASFTPA